MRSNVNAVVNEHSGDTIYAARAAISSISPVRPIGILLVMYFCTKTMNCDKTIVSAGTRTSASGAAYHLCLRHGIHHSSAHDRWCNGINSNTSLRILFTHHLGQTNHLHTGTGQHTIQPHILHVTEQVTQ